MTRDEAVKKAEECFQFNFPSNEWSFTPLRLVAALENLGVLKVDEPRDPMDIVWDAFGPHNTATLQGILSCNDLKVVRC